MSKQKGIAAILIVILIALAVGGYFVYTNYSNNRTRVNFPQPSSSPADETAKPDSIGANWKTYTNSKYRYVIRYPNDWDVVDVHTDEKVTFGGKGSVENWPPLVSIHVFETPKFRKEDIPNYSPFDHKILEKNGHTFLFVASTYQEGGNGTKETEQQAKDALRRIYSTFKFQ